MSIEKIVSGGQTGVDRGALDAALERGFPCGGWCPPGRLAEDGPIGGAYPLRELDHGGYAERTARNVLDADGTAIIYFSELAGGTELTLRRCIEHGKPYALVDAGEVTPTRAAEMIGEFAAAHGIATLNVAGPRASEAPPAHAYAREAVGLVLDALA